METGTTNYMRPEGKGIRLHLGCGDYWKEGYLNIDYAIYGGTDMLFDCRQKLPFQDNVVKIIEAHEFIEHFAPEEINSMLDDWYRLLVDGGQVIVTLPDFDAVIEQYRAEKSQDFIQGIYGMYGTKGQGHKWGYTQESIIKLFKDRKFKDIDVKSIDTGKDKVARMEVKCKK